MRTVITISLNGNAYQLDAVGYDALRAYLHVAEQRLAGNPDQQEILADLEQAIADKCGRYLGPHKNVVTSEEIAEVLREMGPVDGGAGAQGVGTGEQGVGAGGGYGAGGGSATGQTSAAGAGYAYGAAAGGGGAAGQTGAAGSAGAGTASAGVGGGDGFGASGSGATGQAGDASAGAAFGTGAAYGTSGSAGAGSTSSDAPPRHLYQIREGSVISGVCMGLAAYLNIDVSIIRILFVLLVVLTGGVWILVYLVMMFVIPYAETSEQHAAAHGWPFNAEELIARAKAHYAEFKTNSSRWKRRQWRAQRRMYREQRKQWKEQQRAWEKWGSAQGAPPPPPPQWGSAPPANTSYSAQVLNGVLTPLAELLGALLFIAFLITLVAVITRHTLFGWMLPLDIPKWVWIVALIVLYQVIASPLRQVRYAAYYGTPFTQGWVALWGMLVWLGLLTFVAWLLWHNWDQVLDFFQQVSGQWHDFMEHTRASPSDSVRTTVFFLAWVPPCALCGYASGRELESHGEIDSADMLGDAADGDVVDAGLGDGAYRLE
jgi:phage shock protein PspC (stress-responsive transcriptional regulator)